MAVSPLWWVALMPLNLIVVGRYYEALYYDYYFGKQTHGFFMLNIFMDWDQESNLGWFYFHMPSGCPGQIRHILIYN